nr:hypothetical protein [Tanacetum cinerariifolium]
KQAKGGDAWLVTVTWADFKKLFFLQFFPRVEQERLKREYHSIRQTSSDTSTEFMQHFLRLAGFPGAAAGTEDEQAKNFQWGLRSRPLSRVVTGVTIRITTVTDLTGVVEMTTTAAVTITTTTLAITTGSQQSRGPSEGYFYLVCTTCGCRHQGECRRAA